MKTPAIICVDDEKIVLSSLKAELKKYFGDKFIIEVAESGADALLIINELLANNHEVPLVISDYVMPEMKGDELLKLLHERSPKTRKILLTGQATLEGVVNSINWAHLYRYMSKPWDPKDLLMTVTEAIRSYEQSEQLEIKNHELEEFTQVLEQRVLDRTEMISLQKVVIEKNRNKIVQSIHYAKRIQQAVLPTAEFATSIVANHFILFKPKDIVSGDFYFMAKRKNWLLIAVADCTGHGVPGAFMSMLSASFLNEIVLKDDIISASQVLDELRSYIIHSLRQNGTSGEQSDGMDIAFIVINTIPLDKEQLNLNEEWKEEGIETFELQYAGAYNPLYIIKKLKKELIEEPSQPFKLFEFKGDKMPVSIHIKMSAFTNKTIHIQTGDIIYMMSDGFKDQFGGPKDTMFLGKNLKNLLLDNCTKSMEEQRDLLDLTIEAWKNHDANHCEQTDDITIMGIKI